MSGSIKVAPAPDTAPDQARGNVRLRELDRLVGIPAVALLGVARRRRAPPETLRRIGMMKSGAIGDMTLLSAVVRDVRERFPRSDLLVFAGRDNHRIARLSKGVDVV